jgi:hypothetical protein
MLGTTAEAPAERVVAGGAVALLGEPGEELAKDIGKIANTGSL